MSPPIKAHNLDSVYYANNRWGAWIEDGGWMIENSQQEVPQCCA
jgi:hypothetical protein